MARVGAVGFAVILAGIGAGGVLLYQGLQRPGSASASAAVRPAGPQAAGMAGAVPIELLRRHANTCEGYNLELEDAAALQRRINRPDEAARLLAMRQGCAAPPPYVRSAR